MLGLDLAETTTVSIAEATWTIGLLPLLKHEELTDQADDANAAFRLHARTHRRTGEDGKEVYDRAAAESCADCTRLYVEATRRLRPMYRETVRWGLKACDRLTIPEPEKVTLAGREYAILPAEFVERLSRVADGAIVQMLADAIWSVNRLNPREVLGF
jgi:hypothetical protein